MDKFYCETQLSERISKTPEGFLVCHDVPITVAGDMYYNPDQFGDAITAKNGHVRVAKKIEDIHSPETIRSFEGKPITLGHPKDDIGNGVFVTPDNAMGLARGVLQNVRAGSGKQFDKLLADFVIMDKEAISLVEAGDVRQVSCGYNYDASNIQEGFFEQTNIRGNHVALVPFGRAGPQCAIFDSKEEIKNMSLKDKLKEAIGAFSKAIDEAVPDEVSREMATKVKPLVAKAADESPMVQAMEDMAVMSLDMRLSRLESMVADLVSNVKDKLFDKVMTSEAADEAEPEAVKAETEKEETPEEEQKKEEVSLVEEEKEQALDSDTISKVEILAPGMTKAGKDIKRRALDECYKTEPGKKIIDTMLCGKSFDQADTDMLFTATASLLAVHRAGSMKQASAYDAAKRAPDYTKASVLNEVNDQFWSNKQIGVIK